MEHLETLPADVADVAELAELDEVAELRAERDALALQLARLREPKKPLSLALPVSVLRALTAEAQARSMKPAELGREIIEQAF